MEIAAPTTLLALTSGELVKLIENPGYAGWLADEDMVVRGAISPLPDGGFDLLIADSAGKARLADAAHHHGQRRHGQRRARVQRRRQVFC